MRHLIINNRLIADDDYFIIAEIGSNHCGDFALAKQMIEKAAHCGVDAVKFQKRDNRRMFTKAMLNASYNNDFSLGATYGEHRQKLDWFGEKEFVELQALARKLGVLFFATPFEEASADFLEALNVPLYKIASCDVTNIPLIRHVASFGKPILISTGGATLTDIDRVYETIQKHHGNFAFLHCVSSYPNRDDELNLCQIEQFRWRYPDIVIGFSSHHGGIDPVKQAYLMGASILEVHFTLNRGFRGTDHGFSLEPHKLADLCEDLKKMRVRMGKKDKVISESEKSGFIRKMGKAIHVGRAIPEGKKIDEDDLIIKAPADGLPPYELEAVIGRISLHELSTADILGWEDLE